ncbi:MAG: DEAD/DEAH box helicase [Pyramidobacter sp.]
MACSLCSCGKTLVLLPTHRDGLTLLSDGQILGRDDYFFLEEPPLDAQKLLQGEFALRRGSVLSQWCTSQRGILVATPSAIVTPFRFGKKGMALEVGKAVGRDALTEWLARNGYRRTDLVWQPGEFASRGGIVDFFDPSERAPLRAEFFDEEVESLRFFQPRTQRSFLTVSEFILRSVNQASLQRESPVWGDFQMVLVQPEKLGESFTSFADLYNGMVSEKQRLDPDAYEKFLLATGQHPRLRVTAPGNVPKEMALDFGFVPFFKGDLRAARAYADSRLKAGYSIHITSRSLEGHSFPDGVQFHHGVSLSGGTADHKKRQIWISDVELYGISETTTDDIDHGMPLDLQSGLKKNQWVIHEKYGVCRLAGTSTESFGGQDYETVVLEFANSEKLIIPSSELFRLTPWNGDGEPEPDSLGSKRWRSAWKKAEAQIEAEAQGLLTLYAQRELAEGRSFGRDGILLKKFEESFPYKETADQLRAINDIKKDMERPWPMDRLIVGDVGYGKTEVVLRAAVKAVENGAQVAFIAPTTVLALQHYRTCLSRVGDLPIHVELLSRMVPKKKQKEILESVAQGKTDILIGTHRLFQNDLKFKDLGLLIVDEEQRFGVKNKEHYKLIHPGLDVLSLSATPIPRSLSLAMRGIRDISVIATAPKSRGTVFTVTSEWNPALAYDAMQRELSRGGQIYYLHNRVDDIEEVAARISNKFPGHRVAVAHGQMGERPLEKVMNEFYDGKIQILVCTTIIESGLDVPRANTLVVDDVRRLGLAQMHQIRGRIGRRSENGYALFFYEADSGGQTRERLEALDAVGSQNAGYRLAQRDLEIRGAGQILGTEQHGFKERIGYTLYLKKLRERVDELRGTGNSTVPAEIDIPLAIPVEYVPQMELRIGLYRRLLSSLDFQEYAEMKAELTDRYGPIPEQVQGLLDAALIRGTGRTTGMERFKATKGFVAAEGKFVPRVFALPRWISRDGARISCGGVKGLAVTAAEILKFHDAKVRLQSADPESSMTR